MKSKMREESGGLIFFFFCFCEPLDRHKYHPPLVLFMVEINFEFGGALRYKYYRLHHSTVRQRKYCEVRGKRRILIIPILIWLKQI